MNGGEADFTVVVTQAGSSLRLVVSCLGEAVVGRDAAAEIHLPHPLVSRRHARISYAAETGFTVEDLGSRNGTLVAGLVIEQPASGPGPMLVEVGPFLLAIGTDPGDETWTASEQGTPLPRTFVDAGKRQLHVEGKVALDTLSTHEFAFLWELHRSAPNVVARTIAGDAVWGEGQWDVYMLHNLVSRLRRRIAASGADEGVVVTVPGVGYRLA